MSNGVGQYFIYLCIPQCSYQQHLWMEALKLLQRWIDCIWSILGQHQGQAAYTTSMYGSWALVVVANAQRRALLAYESNVGWSQAALAPSLSSSHFFSFLIIYIYTYSALFFFSFFIIFQLCLFFLLQQDRASIVIIIFVHGTSGILTIHPHTWTFMKVKCALLGVSFLVCSITKDHQGMQLIQLTCFQVSYVPCSSQSQPKMVIDQEYPKVHTNMTTCS